MLEKISDKKIIITALIIVVVCIGAAAYFFILKGGIMGIKDGSKVSINYTLTVDGNVVDTSEGKEPLTYVQGSQTIIPGLQKELVGMKKGEKKSVVVQPEEGYGKRNPEAVQKVPRTAFKNADELKVGGMVAGEAQGQRFQAVITELNDKEVTLDLNHPLAGKTLNFDVEVVGVE